MVTSKILIKQLKKELIELQTACTAIESSIYNLPIPEYYDGIKNYEKIKKQISTIAQILNSL